MVVIALAQGRFLKAQVSGLSSQETALPKVPRMSIFAGAKSTGSELKCSMMGRLIPKLKTTLKIFLS